MWFSKGFILSDVKTLDSGADSSDWTLYPLTVYQTKNL